MCIIVVMKYFRLLLVSLAAVACAQGADVNLARFCTATASSSYDHNLTAQLLTDGIVEAEMPAYLEVESSEEGLIGREKSVDNLLAALERSKANNIDRLITGLGIRGVGKQAADAPIAFAREVHAVAAD